MTIGMLFWILWVIWAIFGFYFGFQAEPAKRYGTLGGNLLLLVLFFLVGWKVFGFVIQE